MRGAIALASILGISGPMAASGAPSCDPGNLLAGRQPLTDGRRPVTATVATDGVVGPEGARWDSAVAVILAPAPGGLTWDLDRVVAMRSFVLQADADDRYTILGSLDGGDFERLGEVGEIPGRNGLLTRPLSIATRAVRFLRVEPSGGDGRYSLSELQAFCATPSPWPPSLPVVDAPLADTASNVQPLWNDTSSRWWELVLALGGLALLLWDQRLALRAASPAARRWRDRALAAAGVLAALTYFNFGAFHFGTYIHGWDVFHYYVGAKYFPELGYERLYECVAVADGEEPALRPRVEARRITNLRTNKLEATSRILAQPQRCTSHFSAARWRDFRHDVAWFRNRETPQRWDSISADHGYNATPVWTLAGSLLAGTGAASDRQILLLTLLDPLYFLALLGVVAWAFGWRGLAVALLAFATYFPCRFFWTGGAFLRWDWLFYTVAAVACLRRGRPLLGGLALGYAALLRVFPGFFAIGPLVAVVVHVGSAVSRALAEARSGGPPMTFQEIVRAALAKEPVRSHVRFLAGAVLAAALLVPASLAVAGADAYRGFAANSLKHAGTPLTNNMGLRMVLTYRPDEVGRKLVKDRAGDPWGSWKQARVRAWKSVSPLATVFALAFVALLARAVRRHPEPWVAASLGSLFIAFAADLTSYYYAFVLVPALLWTRRRMVGPLLLGLSAFSMLVSLAPLPGMSTWRDEQYTLVSLATLLAFVAILVVFATGPPGAGVEERPQEEAAAKVVPRGRQAPRRARRRRRR